MLKTSQSCTYGRFRVTPTSHWVTLSLTLYLLSIRIWDLEGTRYTRVTRLVRLLDNHYVFMLFLVIHLYVSKIMSGESSTTLCFQCRSPIRFKPRVDMDSTTSTNSSNVVVDPHGICELILLSEKDLDDYDAEITRLQSQITYAQTQKQKQRLQEYKTTLVHSLLSPFRFPNEILFMVLESACENNLLQEYPWGGLESEQPRTRLSSPAITYLPALAISSVCIQWRSLALALPQLWSRFRVETAPAIFECDPQEVSNGGSGFVKTLQLYLDRSTDGGW